MLVHFKGVKDVVTGGVVEELMFPRTHPCSYTFSPLVLPVITAHAAPEDPPYTL